MEYFVREVIVLEDMDLYDDWISCDCTTTALRVTCGTSDTFFFFRHVGEDHSAQACTWKNHYC
jgi:hypothetical protein